LGIQIFREKKNIQLDLRGTVFQRKVWETLLQIPSGQTATYKEIAALAGNPEAVRATGTAIGANPVAWYIPCHRVIRSDGKPGGYRWGLPLKKKMLLSEGVACSW
jgi:O-6-methylguanine DNA methyltransferase